MLDTKLESRKTKEVWKGGERSKEAWLLVRELLTGGKEKSSAVWLKVPWGEPGREGWHSQLLWGKKWLSREEV